MDTTDKLIDLEVYYNCAFDLDNVRDTALLLCVFFGFNYEEILNLTINSLTEEGVLLNDGQSTRLFVYNDVCGVLSLEVVLKSALTTDQTIWSLDDGSLNDRLRYLGGLFGMSDYFTYDNIRLSGKRSNAFE